MTMNNSGTELYYLCCVNGICQRFALVERPEKGIEALGRINDSLSDSVMNAYIILTSPR